MFPIETSKAGLKRIDYDILDYLEYPKSLDQVKERFPNINVTVKILKYLDKGLIEEKRERYVSKFHTEQVKRIIDDSRVPENVKKNFHFFLSQIDNPFVRQNIFDTESRQNSDRVFSMMTKSLNQELTEREIKYLNQSMRDLMEKLR
ncbi:MAG: hypothetical protein GF368_00710 [Candidatus Aenigmarchaeota archaeon]|nr:hypothetical protein [Candidatus Aenigmarchaeota archaeon]